MTKKQFFIINGKHMVLEYEFYNGKNRLSPLEVIDLLNDQYEQIRALQRHIERSTFNKIRVEDVFNCAKYDKFYDNEEAIKSIDWIAEQLGVDFE